MNFDVDSSVLLLVEAFTERLSKNYLEVLPSVNQLLEFCTMKEKYNQLYSTISNIWDGLSMYDTLTLEV